MVINIPRMRSAGCVLSITSWFLIAVIAGETAVAQNGWQNPEDAIDVTGDGERAANDFHVLRNEIIFHRISTATGELPFPATPPPFYDVEGDTYVSVRDFLVMLNEENSNPDSFVTRPAGTDPSAGPATVSFEFHSAAGAPTSTVSVGDEFALMAIVTDQRVDAHGVFAAYLDLLFDPGLAAPIGPASFVGPFDDNVHPFFESNGTETPFGIEDIGSAVAILGDSLPPQLQLLSLPMLALNAGELAVDGANGYALLTGVDEAIAPSFQPVTLTIVPEPSAIYMALALALFSLPGRRHSRRPLANFEGARAIAQS